MLTSMEAPRRLRRKTTVGHLAIGLFMAQAVAAEAPAAGLAQAAPSAWAQRFLDEEELQDEVALKRKAVYLVTLPHPNKSGESATSALKKPGRMPKGTEM